MVAGLTAAFQYPWRVTPFVEGRFVAGFIGGDTGTLLGKAITTYAWAGGIDVGAEVYLAGRLYVSAALGWVHPVYRGIDVAYARSHPVSDPKYRDISGDSFTFKLGFGL